MPLDIIVGAQWGDEGKGRVVDLLARDADYVARFNGGDNAGHTITVGKQIFKLHLVPSGIMREEVTCYIGNGVVLSPQALIEEVDTLEAAGVDVKGRLRISEACPLILAVHQALDLARVVLTGAFCKADDPPEARPAVAIELTLSQHQSES